MILSSHDQELVFDAGDDKDDTYETSNIDDMTIDIGKDSSVLQDTMATRNQNTTVLTIEQNRTDQELVFNKPSAQVTVGRMSLKGAIPKPDM